MRYEKSCFAGRLSTAARTALKDRAARRNLERGNPSSEKHENPIAMLAPQSARVLPERRHHLLQEPLLLALVH